jgi:hypothetical protein
MSEEITFPDRLVRHGVYIPESVSTFLIHRGVEKGDSQCDLFRLAFIKPQVAGDIIVGASTWVDINVRMLLKVCDSH